MDKEKTLHYLFHISLAVFIIVPIIASMGIVESKFWVEYRIPAFAFALTIFAFYNGLKVNINKLIIN